MTRTLNQRMADAHEQDITEDIDGRLHQGSGNQWSRQMDASNGERLVPFPLAADGKATLGKSISLTREMWAKAVKQTFGKIPTLWLRWYRDEGLRTVDLDLVAIERRDFKEILDAARNWETVRKEVNHDGVLSPEVVVNILRGTRDPGWEAFKQAADISFEDFAPAEEHSGGCDCCR